MRFKRIDIIFITILFMLSFFSKLHSLDYPLMGDSNDYLKGAENIRDEFSYSSEDFHSIYPPMYSIATAPFLFIFKPVTALKISAILWGSILIALIYIFSRLIGLNSLNSFLAALLAAFNPWLFYYAGVLSLSEGIATMLMLLAVIFFMLRKKNSLNPALSGIFFSLSIIARYTMLLFLIPFGLYALIQLLKKNQIKRQITFMVASTIPLGIWVINEFIINGSGFAGGYTSYISDNYTIMYNAHNILTLLMKYLFMSYPVALLLLTPFAVLGIIRVLKEKNLIWKLILIGCLINLIFYSTWTVRGTFLIIRLVISSIPFLIILAYYDIEKRFKRSNLNRNIIITASLAVFLTLTLILNFGEVKEATDHIVKLPETYAQKSMHKDSMISWVNKNLPSDSAVTFFFEDAEWGGGMDAYIDQFFRRDIEYYSMGNPLDDPIDTHYIILYKGKAIEEFKGGRIYIISDIEESGMERQLNEKGINYEISKMIREEGNVRLYSANIN